MKKFLSLALTILLCQNMYAQNKVWNLAQCIEQALQKNIQINQSRLSNEINKVNLDQSKFNRVPTLNGSANNAYSFGRPIDPFTNQYVNQTVRSNNFSVNSSVTLFNGFQNQNAVQQNRLNYEAGTYDVEKAKNDIALNISFAYLQVLFYEEQLNNSRNQIQISQAQLERTEKLVNAGSIAESNLFQIRSQMATDKLAVVNGENQVAIAKVNLMQLMEIPVIDDFQIEKPVLPDPQPTTTMKGKEEIYNIALEKQPQIKSAELRKNSAMVGLNIAKGARMPRLSLNGGLNTGYSSARTRRLPNGGIGDYPFGNQFKDNFNQSASLNLAIPLLNNRQVHSSIQRAEINRMSTDLNQQNIKNQLRKNIEQAYVDLVASSKKFEASKEQLTALELTYQNTEKKYNVGLINALDYLIQKNNFIVGQSSLLQAKYDYIFKSKILDFYQGIPITF